MIMMVFLAVELSGQWEICLGKDLRKAYLGVCLTISLEITELSKASDWVQPGLQIL